MDVEERKKQVRDLVHVVLGIRLFNRAVNKGGAGLSDVFEAVGTEVNELVHLLDQETQDMYDETIRYAEVINFEYANSGSIGANWQRLQEELAHRRQYMAYIRQLHAECMEVGAMINMTKSTYDEQMAYFKKMVGERPSVPKDEVYPRFQMFARLWIAVSDEKEKNDVRKAVFHELRKLRDSFQVTLSDADVELALSHDSKMDEQLDLVASIPLVANEPPNVDPLNAPPVRLTRETSAEFMTLPMEFQGYCAWSIVHRRGLLLPGNPNVGLVRHQGKFYSFAHGNGMLAFYQEPNKYLESVLIEAQRHPELIHLLRLQDLLPYAAITTFIQGWNTEYKNMFDDEGAHIKDAETGTPLHFVERHIDREYDWNEWSLRKKAIKLANLRKKCTHSTQTDLSHFKRDAETQVYLPKLQKDGTMPGTGTQVGISTSTNTSVVRRQFTGLRGSPNAKFNVVTLDLA
eukprot:TRINITY_DN3541_c0_g1_i7.p1 TRINITY_DN3541_c0_g1~~TRINITY_DN3541_c0_g1_i7.p1  ORF type:complete len:460 (+),score=79.98 TRINITY_DN3541_c0_g1_i7:112-1491(+)